MHNILKIVIAHKKRDLTFKENKAFRNAVLDNESVAVIGELKFASPTNSHIGSKDILLKKVEEYKKAGIHAISIITEKYFFKGESHFIPQVRQATNLPILQKDFIIDEAQIYEAKFLGSDALLFIARIVDNRKLRKFVHLAKNLGIEPVVEISSEEDLQKALATTTDIIAVNARDLDTFTLNIEKACFLMNKIPKKYIRLGFSGIVSKKEILQYKKAGANGVLIGTSLMKARDVHNFVKDLRI